MQKLFPLKRIFQNPNRIVPFGRAGHRFYHTSPPPLQEPTVRIPLLFRRLLHNNAATYLKPKSSSSDLGQFGFQIQRYLFPFGLPFSYRPSDVRKILKTHGVLIDLIATNVAVFLLWKVADTNFMCKNFTLYLDNIKSGRLHTMITYAFSHAEGSHLFFNMLWLCVFGKRIGEQFGPKYLLKLYLAGAFVGSAFFLAHKAFLAISSKVARLNECDPSKVAGMGASAAVRAIMTLSFISFLREKIPNKFARAIILVLCIVGDEMAELAIRRYREIQRQRQNEKHSTPSQAYAHMGSVAVAAIAWARLRKGCF